MAELVVVSSAPDSNDILNIRRALEDAVKLGDSTARLHILIFYHPNAQADNAGTIPAQIRSAVSHAYMTAWDVLEEVGKPLVQVIAYPVPIGGETSQAQKSSIARKVLRLDPSSSPQKSQAGSQAEPEVAQVFVDVHHASGSEYARLYALDELLQEAVTAGTAKLHAVVPEVTPDMRGKQEIISLNGTHDAPTFENVVMGGTSSSALQC